MHFELWHNDDYQARTIHGILMGLKSFLAKPYARYIVGSNKRWINKPVIAQERVFKSLINQGKKTLFGKDHSFENIKNYNDFRQNVPIVDYEKLRPTLI